MSRDDESFPGWACVLLQFADGTEVELADKQPVLGIDCQRPGETVHLDCVVTRSAADLSTIRLLHGVESPDGRDTLNVLSASLAQRD